jgi:hypothetical protein
MKQWVPILLTLGAVVTAGAEDATVKNPRVLLDTSEGKIVLELYQDKAPVTVKNFLDYVDAGFYDNTVFHRVIPDGFVQGRPGRE